MKRGRAFNERDNAAAPPVVIINEAMAKKFWPKADPLDDRIWIGKGVMPEFAAESPRQIIGIVGDVRDGGLNNDPGPPCTFRRRRFPTRSTRSTCGSRRMAWVVRTRANPHTVSAAVQEQLRQASGLPVSDVRTMDEVVSRSTSRQRFNMLLMTVFGSAALLLAAIGIYGLMAYSVQQRTQEIGIRLALGAEHGQVRNMVVFQGMRLALTGVVIGMAAALGLTRVIASFLFGVKAKDPLVFIAVPVLLSLVALLAVWLPARRATRIDPVKALRYE